MKKHQFKEGDCVRVARAYYHYGVFGAVGTVVGNPHGDGDVHVLLPVSYLGGKLAVQSVDPALCKPAKQATKKVRK